MSISNLFHPNDYDLFCNSITITNEVGNVPIVTVDHLLNVPITVNSGSTIVTYSVRNVTQSLPAVIPTLAVQTLSSGTSYKQITIKIPEFLVLTSTGGPPNAILLTLPGKYAPLAGTNCNAPIVLQTSSTVSVVGICQVTASGGNTVITLTPLNSALYTASNFGILDDFTFVYNPID